MATREQIERLKKDWASDPCWDIETTEGFEGHEEELKNFAAEKEDEWSEQRQRRLERLAEDLGWPGNLKLAAQFENFMSRLEQLESRESGDQGHF